MSQQGRDASDIVNELDETELADIIWRFEQERASRRIARAIVRARLDARIERTGQLADIIHSVMPRPKPGQADSATRTFQALRIYINGEPEELEQRWPIVKSCWPRTGYWQLQPFAGRSHREKLPEFKAGISPPSRHRPERAPPAPAIYRLSPRKPILPSENEITVNARSRPANCGSRTALPLSFNREERSMLRFYSYLLFCSGGQWQRPLYDQIIG